MHPALVQAVLPGLRELAGRPVTKVELLGKHGLLMRFGRGRSEDASSRGDLWLSTDPERPRVGAVGRIPAVGDPRPGPDNLTEPLLAARLQAVESEPGGRVVRLSFERAEGRHRCPVLACELIPRFANVILVGDDDRILWCRREFTGAGRPRQIGAGETYVPPSGAPGDPGPPPIEIAAGASAAEANDAVDSWYLTQEETEADRRLAAELRRAVARRRKRAAKALRQIEARLAEAEREPEIRRAAELLAANLRAARRGMESVTLPDFDGETDVTVPLDPKLDPQANADALFKKARRLARGLDDLLAQRSLQAEEITRADRAGEALDGEPTGDALRAIVQDIAPSLLTRPRGGPPEPARTGAAEDDGSPPVPFRRYVLPGGWEVWVGRSASQNDELTHKWAAQRDLWFHARGAQGSHTVLRVSSGKGEPPRAAIEGAAAIAAWHSKARNSNLVPVAYTEKRYVRKPRKSPVGTAMMMREKVIMVKPALPV